MKDLARVKVAGVYKHDVAVRRLARKFGLPDLVGDCPDQEAWGESLRYRFLMAWSGMLKKVPTGEQKQVKVALTEVLVHETHAAYWIENRGLPKKALKPYLTKEAV